MKGIMMLLDVEKALKAVQSRLGTALNLQGSIKDFSEIENMLKEERSQFEVRYFLLPSRILPIFIVFYLMNHVGLRHCHSGI